MRAYLKGLALRLLGKVIAAKAPPIVKRAADAATDEWIRGSLDKVEVSDRIKEISEMDLRKVNGGGLGSSPSDPLPVFDKDGNLLSD